MDWGDFFSKLLGLYGSGESATAQLAVYTKRCMDSLLTLAIAFVLVQLVYLVIRVAGRGARRAAERMGREDQVATIESLLRSILKYAIYIAAIIAVLRIWQVDTRSLIVGSAILGGAVAFGSQGLIQDVITGLSLLFENQLAVGDWVDIGGKKGVVEEVGLRAVKIRDTLGQQHIIFNRSISSVTNYTSGAVAVCTDLIVPNVDRAERFEPALERMAGRLGADRTRFCRPLELARAGETGSGETIIRLTGCVVPFQTETVRTELERGIRRIARSLEIELPPDNLTVTFSAVPEEG